MASELFEELMISDIMGGTGTSVTVAIPTNKACNHVRLPYVIAKFNRQSIFRVLIDNRTTLNVLLALMLRKLDKKKSDMLPPDLIMANFCDTVVQPLGVISTELIVGH